MYKLKPYLVIVLTLSFLLAACQPAPAAGPATEAAAEQPKAPAGEKIVAHLGYLGKPDTLNPAYAFLMESYYIFDLVLGTMTIENPDGEYIGDLATE
jgi:ABC-type transport system substrate-binding protein